MCLHVFQGFLSLPNFFPNVSSCVQTFLSMSILHKHTHVLTHSLTPLVLHRYISEHRNSYRPDCSFHAVDSLSSHLNVCIFFYSVS